MGLVVIICMSAILPHMGWYLTQVHNYSLWLCYVNSACLIPEPLYLCNNYLIVRGKQTIDGNQDSLLCVCVSLYMKCRVSNRILSWGWEETGLASFPGPAQFFVTCSTEKRGEPGIFSHMSVM